MHQVHFHYTAGNGYEQLKGLGGETGGNETTGET